MVDDHRDALAWFNDASKSIAQKVAALTNADPDVPAPVFDVLNQLDQWWEDNGDDPKRDALLERRREELGPDDRQLIDAALSAINNNHPTD